MVDEAGDRRGALPPGAVCAHHPEARAVLTCERCGNFACAQCRGNRYAAFALCRDCELLGQRNRYYVVPPARVVLLYVVTLGLYGLVWNYRQWRAIKAKDRSSIWPLPRALFANFTLYLLIHDLNDRSREATESSALLGQVSSLYELNTGIALAFFAFGAVTRWLPEPYRLASLLGGFCLYPLAKRIAELEGPAALAQSQRVSALEYGMFAAGAALVALYVWGQLGSP